VQTEEAALLAAMSSLTCLRPEMREHADVVAANATRIVTRISAVSARLARTSEGYRRGCRGGDGIKGLLKGEA
jgi:hypothetical protein